MPRSKNRGGKNKFSAYFNPKHPGSFSGVSGFLKNNKNINQKKFKEWSKKVPAITLHKPARKRFPRRKVLVFATGDLFQIDLMDFQSLSKFNNGFKFVSLCASITLIAVTPAAGRASAEVADALKRRVAKPSMNWILR